MISLILRRQFSLSAAMFARVTKVPLPALSPTMESGTIVSWDKKEGDQLSEGDLLAEIETDKATMAFETPEEGYLAKILIPAGTKGVPLGQPLCIIVESEDDLGKFKDFTAEQAIAEAGGGDAPAPAAAAPATSEAAPPTSPPPTSTPPTSPPPQPQQQQSFTSSAPPPPTPPPTATQGRIFASPLAKRLAQEMSVQLPASGSGPNGRVVAEDLKGTSPAGACQIGGGQAATIAPPPPPTNAGDFVDIPLTNMRQTIAKRLTQSKQSIPHYYLTVNLKVDELLQLRQRVNAMLAKESNTKLSVNDFIVKAAALSCKKVPQVNSIWQDSFIRQYNRVDVCVAVATDNGLITPIVFNAEGKGIQDIGAEIKGLAERARQGKLQPHEFQGGTFTISNLGMFDISHFTAVINPPQSAILAVGSTQQVLKPSEENQDKFVVTNTLNVTLSCDHRVVDGAVGAHWLQWFRKYIEKPMNMLL